MKLKPTAVISGASFGALRNGLYATFSISMFRTAQPTAASSRQTGRPRTRPVVPVDSVSPRVAYMPTAMNDPIMKTSPCAKLMSSMIP